MAALETVAEIEIPRAAPRSSLGWVFWLAVAWIAIVVFGALAADLLPLGDPSKISLLQRRQPPSALHLFGTDHLGRDVLARVVHGTRAMRRRASLMSSPNRFLKRSTTSG